MAFGSFRLTRFARGLRLARLVLACLVLATAFVPAPSRALAYADSIVWVAGPKDAAAEEASSDRQAQRSIERAPAHDRAAAPFSSRSRFVARRPAQARTRIVRRRLYVTHAAFLC